MIKIEIGKNDKGQRLDRFLKKYFDAAPLSMIYRLIRKDVKVNGKRGKEATLLEEGDVLTVYITEEQAAQLHRVRSSLDGAQYGDGRGDKRKKAARQFKVAYEDDEMLIVSKPFGLLTHGDRTEKKNTLANQVAGYLQEKGDYDPAAEQTFRPSPVNRLDRNTTGLVIFGKTAEATRRLAAMFREKGTVQNDGSVQRAAGGGACDRIGKFYLTIVSGRLEDEMVIDGALEKDEATNTVNVYLQNSGRIEHAEASGRIRHNEASGRIEHAEASGRIEHAEASGRLEHAEASGREKSAGAKRSVTIVRPVAWSDEHSSPDARSMGSRKTRDIYTLVEAELVTGRTHQIRAHLAAAGFPIIGDSKYGDSRVNKRVKEKYGLTTQLLHAFRLEFADKGVIMKVTAPLPKRFEQIKTDLFGKNAGD